MTKNGILKYCARGAGNSAKHRQRSPHLRCDRRAPPPGRPMGFTIDDKKLKRAGLDYWHLLDITYYDSLASFFGKNSGPFYYFSTKAPNRYSDISYPDGAYLVFGKETKGLPESLLHENPESCVRLPMRKGLRSLNLSNSVAIGVYEALRQWDFPDLQWEGNLTQYCWEE